MMVHPEPIEPRLFRAPVHMRDLLSTRVVQCTLTGCSMEINPTARDVRQDRTEAWDLYPRWLCMFVGGE